MGDSLPPKKLWLRRKDEASTQQPPVTSNNPDAQERESSRVPEAAVLGPGGTPPVLQTPERSRTTESDATLSPSPREHSPDTLQTGCFEAMRNALLCSVIRFAPPKRKRRRAVYEPSSERRNESPTGRGKESTRRGSDDKSDRGARRRSFDPESSGEYGSGCSPRKRALQAAPNAKSESTKTSLDWADLEEPTASGFAEASGQKDPDTSMPAEHDWASEDTVGYPGDISEEPRAPSFSRVLPEALKTPEPMEASSASTTSRPVVDVDRLLMPPPPVPWVKLTRQKMRQLSSGSTSKAPSSSLFSAAHFHNYFAERRQSSTSSQSSASTDVGQQSAIARPRTLSLGNERAHRKQSISGEARTRSFSLGSEHQHRRQGVWSESGKEQLRPSNEEVDLSRKGCLKSHSASRELQFNPISHARTSSQSGESHSEDQESERGGSCPDIGKLSLEAQPEAGSLRENQYSDRVSVRVRKDSGSFQENFTRLSVPDEVSAPYIAASRDAGRSEPDKSSAPQWLSSKDRQELRWKGAASRSQDGSSKQTAIDVDDKNVPVASEFQHHDTAANLAEASMPPAASAATIWVPTKTASSVTATDFTMASQTPIDVHTINVPEASETQQHGTAVDVTGTAMSTAEPGATVLVPTKTASSTTTTDFATTSHRFLSW